MMRFPLIALFAMLALAPLAAADRPSDDSTHPTDEREQAWVDDCPPDSPCAAGDASGNESPDEGNLSKEENATRGPDGCEHCRGDERVDGNASGELPADSGSDCMDGQQEGETCRDDVQYMTPPDDGPTYSGDCGGEVCAPSSPPVHEDATQGMDDQNAAPAAGVFLVGLGAVAAAALAATRRKQARP